jgi:hypothetical protein
VKRIAMIATAATCAALGGCALGEEPGAAADDEAVASDSEAIVDRSQALADFFPIAADYQPHSTFDTWKKRGVNTVVRVPGADNVKDWSAKAKALGLKMIREPAKDPHDDVGDKDLLAWHWDDEPELHGVPASKLAADAKHWHAIDPTRPVLVNFWGGGILQNPDGCYGPYCYADYAKRADWVSHDIYPCNKYDCNIKLVGKVLSQLRKWAPAPRQAFAYIETSDWDGNGTGPSPRRFRAEVWDAIIHGARGVFYFCVRLKPNCQHNCMADWDATPADIVAEMKDLHPRLEALAPVLQGKINPDGASLTVPEPLEVGWRKRDGRWYFIVLNPTAKEVKGAKLRWHGIHPSDAVVISAGSHAVHVVADKITADFAPYQERIYRVAE